MKRYVKEIEKQFNNIKEEIKKRAEKEVLRLSLCKINKDKEVTFCSAMGVTFFDRAYI